MDGARRAGPIIGLTGLIVALALVPAVPGWAQSRGAGLGASRGAASFRVAAPVHAHPARMAVAAGPLNPNFGPIQGAPGLGFDYAHLVTVGQPLRYHDGRRRVSFVTPILFNGFFNGGYPLYYGDDGLAYSPETSAPDDSSQQYPQQPSVILEQAPPQTIVIQTPATQTPDAEDAAPDVAPDYAATAAQPDAPDVGQFILVRRDGQVVMAVAFTIAGGRLTYITSEGTRRSFLLAELDMETTRQMNDVNGTTLELPN